MALPSNGRETAVAKPCARPGSRFPGPPAQAIRCGGLSDSDHAIASAAEDIPGRTAVRERLRLPRRGHGTAVGHRGGQHLKRLPGGGALLAGLVRGVRLRRPGGPGRRHRPAAARPYAGAGVRHPPPPRPGKVVGPRDVCPGPGLARLSYGRPAPCWTSTPPCAGRGPAGTCTSTAVPPCRIWVSRAPPADTEGDVEAQEAGERPPLFQAVARVDLRADQCARAGQCVPVSRRCRGCFPRSAGTRVGTVRQVPSRPG